MIEVFNDIHASTAGLTGQRLAQGAGFSTVECTAIQTAIMEVARNIVRYAERGQIVMQIVHDGDRVGLEVSAVDNGPGIADLVAAFQDGFTTGHSLGRGLPGAKRLMDQFELTSQQDKGTSITMTKWKS